MRPFPLTLAALGDEAVFQKETKSCSLCQVPGFVIEQRTQSCFSLVSPVPLLLDAGDSVLECTM